MVAPNRDPPVEALWAWEALAPRPSARRGQWFAAGDPLPCTVRRRAAELAACGGGDDAAQLRTTFDINVAVAGHVISAAPVVPARPELDASEPVVWRLVVGGSTVTGSGTTVYYAGSTITQTEVSDSRIVVDTSAAYALVAPGPITLLATSTLDSAQVATVNVLITN